MAAAAAEEARSRAGGQDTGDTDTGTDPTRGPGHLARRGRQVHRGQRDLLGGREEVAEVRVVEAEAEAAEVKVGEAEEGVVDAEEAEEAEGAEDAEEAEGAEEEDAVEAEGEGAVEAEEDAEEEEALRDLRRRPRLRATASPATCSPATTPSGRRTRV